MGAIDCCSSLTITSLPHGPRYASQCPTTSARTNGCVVETSGDSITILQSGPVGTIINWTVTATDTSGNQSTAECSVEVVKPPKVKSGSSKSKSSGSKAKSDDGDKKKNRRNRRGKRSSS